MTKMALGPSLPQARGANSDTQHQHNHRHLHSHIRARHHHHHSDETIGDDTHIRSHEKRQQEQPHQRDAFDLESNLITEVVQTVSVVQVVDGSGSPIEIKTYFPDSAVTPDNSDVGLTAAGATTVDPAATTAAVPSSDDVLPSETAADSSAASAPLSSLPGPGSLTSAPSSTFTSHPSLPGVYNVTSRPSFFNSTNNHSLFANSTTASIHSNTSFSFSLSTTSHLSSTLLTSTTEVPVVTVLGNGDAPGAAGAPGATLTVLPTSTSTASSSPGGPLDPTTSSIVGGIVGGFAGIALVVLAVLIAAKWKRQHGKGIQLLAEGDGPENRGPSFSSRGGPGGPGGGPGSWAIPAALASLAGHKPTYQATIEGPGPETSEKGFYRISGRKLTSVLQSGGDGYGEPSSSDIRASTISGTSLYRPDSIAMFSDPNSRSPLQLGSPMRPESGIMIMRSGPARTPMEEHGPVFDDTGTLTPPVSSADRDPLGRSLVSQSGSGASAGSPSRFTESIS